MASICLSLLLVRAIIFFYTKTSPTKKKDIMEEETKNNGARVESIQEGEEDPFNNIPDAILSAIISFLPTKEAVRTSVLSKRWKTLWTYNTHLDFNQKFMMEHEFQILVQSSQSLPPLGFSKFLDNYKLILRKISKADSLIKSIMKTHQGNLHRCSILHMMESCFNKPATTWVKHLLEKKVQELSLACESNSCWHVYEFDHNLSLGAEQVRLYLSFEILSQFRVLELTNYFLKTPTQNFGCSNKLKTLKLKMVWLYSGMLEMIISNCVSLENLSLFDCKRLKMLRIHSASIKFLELRDMLVHCIDLSAFNLEFLELVSVICRTEGALINAPNLMVFRSHCHTIRGKTKPRPGRFPLTVKEIVKDYTHHSNSEGPSRANTFENLVKLCIDFDLNNARELIILPSILRLCACLQTLEINNQFTGEVERRNDSIKLPYFNSMFWETRICDWISEGMKTICIKGFKGKPLELKFVKYLITRATMIEKIILCFDYDYTREGATVPTTLLSLVKASTNVSITFKPGKVHISKVGGIMEDSVSSI